MFWGVGFGLERLVQEGREGGREEGNRGRKDGGREGMEGVPFRLPVSLSVRMCSLSVPVRCAR